jgi:hypothetical protein
MRIREINAMRGPNYWSVRRHKLIVMVLDLQDIEQKPTNLIPGFLDRLKEMFPGMYEHRCSVGCPGGFFQRVYADKTLEYKKGIFLKPSTVSLSGDCVFTAGEGAYIDSTQKYTPPTAKPADDELL